MPIKTHDKLIRDKIPEVISANNQIPIVSILERGDIEKYLRAKLIEEAKEVVTASDAELTEEIADVLEIISTLLKLKGISWAEVEAVQQRKHMKKGGFDYGLFLHSVIEP